MLFSLIFLIFYRIFLWISRQTEDADSICKWSLIEVTLWMIESDRNLIWSLKMGTIFFNGYPEDPFK